jgi:lysophospholipase L1-like esterase
MPRRRVFLFAATALLLGGAGALVVVEITLRILHLAPSAGVVTVTETEFARVPGLFGPGQNIIDRQLPALPFAVRINSLGFRGRDLALEKAPHELRILAVGDSFTYGDFVDDDETLPSQLEDRLARVCARPVTVINAGVGGSTLDTHLEMTRRGWVTRPDVVLLTFSENDVTDLKDPAWEALAANRRAKSRFPLSVAYPVLRHLAVWHFALEWRARLHARSVRPVAASDARQGARTEIAGLRNEYERLLRALADDVRSRRATLVLAAFPSHLTVSGTWTDEQLSWLDETATRAGIPGVNVLAALRATGQPAESLYLLPHDGHASPRGNAVAAGAVAQRLIELGFCRPQSLDDGRVGLTGG